MWKKDLHTERALMLPLVTNVDAQHYPPGWVSYAYTLADSPEVEVLSGGCNEKTIDGAAIWREGNLMHFGFQPSPAEMNETGKSLLVDAITYIARFTEDRPIVHVKSPFAAGGATLARESLAHLLKIEDYALDDLLEHFDPQTIAALKGKSREACQRWFEEVRRFVRPNAEGRLAIDADLRALDLTFDAPDFFERAVSEPADPERAAKACAALTRCAPEGPGATATLADWRAWHDANKPFLFYSEYGGYRWYIDPLAKKRGVPSTAMRGVSRADQPVGRGHTITVR